MGCETRVLYEGTSYYKYKYFTHAICSLRGHMLIRKRINICQHSQTFSNHKYCQFSHKSPLNWPLFKLTLISTCYALFDFNNRKLNSVLCKNSYIM